MESLTNDMTICFLVFRPENLTLSGFAEEEYIIIVVHNDIRLLLMKRFSNFKRLISCVGGSYKMHTNWKDVSKMKVTNSHGITKYICPV